MLVLKELKLLLTAGTRRYSMRGWSVGGLVSSGWFVPAGPDLYPFNSAASHENLGSLMAGR